MKRHTIEFIKATTLTVAIPSGKGKATRDTLKVGKGERLKVFLKPFVDQETLIEAADLYLPDGSEAMAVPYAKFRFV